MDWATYYPAYAEVKQTSHEQDLPASQTPPAQRMRKEVTVADIGCGFGGLLVALASKLPDELLLGRDNSANLVSQDS